MYVVVTSAIVCALLGTCIVISTTTAPSRPTPSGPTKIGYVVMAPSVFRPGLSYFISVRVIEDNPQQYRYVAAFLDREKQILAQGVTDDTNTVRIQVPLVAPQSSYTLRVQAFFVGGKLLFDKSTTIRKEKKNKSIFIQTDKGIYKPGQTVMFRAFAVNPNLKPYLGPLDIEIYDPNKNKLVQLLQQQNKEHGVVSNSMEISDQPVQGDWKIVVTAGDQSTEKEFSVEEYVLPKFEVKILAPSYIVKESRADIPITLEAKYTYGEMVKGTAVITIKLTYTGRIDRLETPIPVYKKVITKFEGRKTVMLSYDDFIGLIPLLKLENRPNGVYDPKQGLQYRKLVVTASMTEGVSGVNLDADEVSIPITLARLKLEFLAATPSNFKPGLVYSGFVMLKQADGQPPRPSDLVDAANKPIKMKVVFSYYNKAIKETKEYYVPASGLVRFSWLVPSDFTRLNVMANFGMTQQYKYGVQKFNTIHGAGIQVSLKGMVNGALKAGDLAKFVVRITDPKGTERIYLELHSKGVIVLTESRVADSNQLNIDVYITAKLAQKMSPTARAIAWCVTGEELITDSLEFNVAGAFANKVSLKINTEKTEPGKSVKLTVEAYKRSYAALLAIDSSVLLLKSGNDITQDMVLDELAQYDSNGRVPNRGIMPMMRDRCMWCGMPYFGGGTHSMEILTKAGVTLMTDISMYTPYRSVRRGTQGAAGRAGPMGAAGPQGSRGSRGDADQNTPSGSGASSAPRVRSAFPETWLWMDSADIGKNGKWTMTTKVPDTITSWVASAFAISKEKGLGVVPDTVLMTVFKPFFVSLNLPYSVIRNEEFALTVMVFNYLKTDLTATITLAKSDKFSVKLNPDSSNTVSKDVVVSLMIPAGEAASVAFWVVPEVLGNIPIKVTALAGIAADALERNLLVEPEGAPQEYTKSVIIDLKEPDTNLEETVETPFPDNVIEGSQYITVSAIGSAMGSSVQGLGKLLRMPYGCGEQNMLNFAPAIPILDYLKVTNQLTSELKAKATLVLETGYKRELNYQHTDGSFSAFGNRDKSGSMWLTAFVMRSFKQAIPYIYFMDENVISRAAQWIFDHQEKSGAFPEPPGGKVIHTNMQGGSSKGVALSAYVLAALKESESGLSGTTGRQVTSAIERGTAHLESEVVALMTDPAKHLYELAIIAYALKLVKSSMAGAVIAKLDTIAKTGGGMTHWEIEKDVSLVKPSAWRRPYHQAAASDIEVTAYMLLTYLLLDRVQAGVPISKWLIAQRTPQGGFASTQDTVLAIYALAGLEGQLQSGVELHLDIRLVVDGETVHKFDTITEKNSLVMQLAELPGDTERVKIIAVGEGTGVVQVGVAYHIAVDDEEDAMLVNVTTKDLGSGKLGITACVTYLKEKPSGMTILQVDLLSGSQADVSHLLNSVDTLKRVEPSERSINLYFDKFDAKGTCVSFSTVPVIAVGNKQPARVQAYSYYNTNERHSVFYGSRDKRSACESCPVCCQAPGKPTSPASSATTAVPALALIIAVVTLAWL